MKAFKFLIPPGDERELPPAPGQAEGAHLLVDGYFAVVIHETEAEARARLVEAMQLDGEDHRWLQVADVHQLDLVPGAVLIRGAVR